MTEPAGDGIVACGAFPVRVPVILLFGLIVLGGAAGAWWWIGSSTATPRDSAAVRDRSGAPAEPLPSSSTAPAEAEPRPPAPTRRRAAPEEPVAEPAAVPEPVPAMATLLVESDVPGATVFIDRVSVGTAPITIRDLAPGSHRLNVSATGYEAYGETLDLAPGLRTVTVSFKEIRLDAATGAIHKHGVGSCQGQLAATPQGLRYAAADGKDNFSTALADLETFEIDYLAKNLRVRTRQGRTFNFTTSDPTADGLLRFHAEVDKARKRLAAQ